MIWRFGTLLKVSGEFIAYEGISVNKSNVIALRDIQTAMGGAKLVYQKGTTVRGRKNPK